MVSYEFGAFDSQIGTDFQPRGLKSMLPNPAQIDTLHSASELE
jgi:hypothetical protein